MSNAFDEILQNVSKQVIATANLKMIPFEDLPEHYSVFKEIFTDSKIMKGTMSFDGSPAPENDKLLMPIFQSWIELNIKYNYNLSFIVTKNNSMCGIFLTRIYEKNDLGEIIGVEFGHFYKPEYNAIAYEIGLKTRKMAFDIPTIEYVVGKMRADNVGSQALAIRGGFRFDSYCIQNNVRVNLYHFKREKFDPKTTTIADLGCSVSEYIAKISNA